MYEVIKGFVDLKDADHLYKVGDVFPRKGVEADSARIAELCSFSNRVGEPLIREKIETIPKTLSEASEMNNKPLTETVQTFTRTDIARMNKENLISLAKEKGIKDADGMSGNALKLALVDALGL